MNKDFIIPVDSAIQEFRDHLKCHPRSILSARYGDGKSYFIDAFMKDPTVKKEFQILKIYPVNYQVLENRDIFDIIKYDVLLQMGLSDMLDPSQEISSRDAFLFCMKSNGLNLLESLFSVASSIEGVSTVKAIGKVGEGAVGVIKKIQEAVNDYRKYKGGESSILDKYMGEIDKTPIYEEDPITKIIQNNIVAWRKKRRNKNKKIVLLFEDMDRIDPAHLFRILNVFSAHMDFSYKYAIKPDDSLYGNKFGVDNVVMVIHYENLESIFHHFYGDNTCFEGYIHKFADKGRFVYSLKAESLKYYYQCLVKVTNLPETVLKEVLPDDRIRSRTLRELGNSLDFVKQQRKEIADCSNDITALMVCMRRLGLDDNEIISCFRRTAEQNMAVWMRYLYPYLNHFGLIEEASIQLVDHEGRRHGYYFHNKLGGLEVCSSSFVSERHFWKIGEIIQQVLTLVSK